MDLKSRLLAHRVRGFGYPEGSMPALRAALDAGVPYVEIDTRVTLDRQILVYHDARLDTMTSASGYVARYDVGRDGPISFRDDPGVNLCTLAQFVEAFASHPGSADVQIMVDVKDRSMVEEHCAVLDRFGVLSRSWIISWFPEVLARAHVVSADVRLGFSHVPLTRWMPLLVPLAHVLGTGALIRLLGRALTPVNGAYANLCDVRLHLDAPASDHGETDLLSVFPVHLLARLPSGELGDALRRTGGGVGMPSLMLTPAFVEAAHAKGLKVFVYSIDTPDAFARAVARSGPDIIFSNAGGALLKSWI